MTNPVPKCRGFTHPLLLLVRSTLGTRVSLQFPSRTASSSLCLPPTPSHQERSFIERTIPHQKTPKPIGIAPAKTSMGPATSSLRDKIQTTVKLSYAQRLAMRRRPTILYEAASQKGFLISSYTAGLFCFSSAGINSWFNVYNLPEGISSWVPVGFGVITFVFAALGTVFALRPASIIRSIKVLPYATGQTPGSALPRVKLEVAARRNAPFPLPPMRIQVEPHEIVLVNRMLHRHRILTKEEMAAKKLEDAKRRKQEREYELNHLMTAPFRDAGKASSTILGNVRRGLTGEGFAPVFIRGVRYKLDIDGGYALENGQVLDRLVKIQPDPELARLESKTN
ncbi:hypothetical protein F5Y19DRAFT_445139 [Xylariaceae sp. FL1651]|nr:hypothetical protein F5Y19DRAFT_445139 [Xylariaceae sp. FL1651]